MPWLPEFPARGPWAGMVGRALGLLDGLGAELSAGEWRLAAVPGLDQRRAKAALRDDLDVLEENAQGLAGPLKVAVTGPWTLASAVLRPLGGRVLGDRGARRDLAQSLASGVRGLVADVERRLPGVEVLLQVDEPSLPAVLAGGVPTEGGYFRHRGPSTAPRRSSCCASWAATCCTAARPASTSSWPSDATAPVSPACRAGPGPHRTAPTGTRWARCWRTGASCGWGPQPRRPAWRRRRTP